MRKFGLIGYPLEHSFSKKYFEEKFQKESISDTIYRNYPLKNISELPALIENDPEICGLNVTIPYKKEVISLLDYIDSEASSAGAVNVIKILRNKDEVILKGYNTDIYGFRESLRPLIEGYTGNAVILGTGGSSSAVAYVLSELGIKTIFVSRQPKPGCITYKDLTENIIKSSHLIVNTTPVGMYPATGNKPDIPYESLTSEHILYDLIYNPEQTLFLKEGVIRGCRVMNGITMLILQAEKSWEIWNDLSR